MEIGKLEDVWRQTNEDVTVNLSLAWILSRGSGRSVQEAAGRIE